MTESAESNVLEELKESLEGLKRTQDGALLFRMIDKGLSRFKEPGRGTEEALLKFIYTLLGRYAGDSTGNPVTRVKARLIQQRLAPHIDFQAIREAAKQPVRQAPPPAPAAPTTETPAPVTPPPAAEPAAPAASAPSLGESARPASTGASEPVVKQPAPEGVNVTEEEVDDLGAPEVVEDVETAATGIDAIEVPGVEEMEEAETPITGEVIGIEISEAGAHNVYRGGTADDRVGESGQDAQVQDLPSDLAEQIANTVARNDEFNRILKSNLKVLQLAEDANDLMDLKMLLMRGLEDLMHGQEVLTGELSQANQVLEIFKADRKQLQERVAKLSRHGYTDELTGLPKRETLIRQIEAEVGRARRYGFSLALSIVDIDNLESINQKYGREVGDEILNIYTREILSHFRAYDFVARYGGDEFAILFPNTPKDGAYRALEKARKHAADMVVNINGQSIELPGFSSVLTLYSHGERPEALLQRADDALSLAKSRGSGQTLVSLPNPQ